MDSKTSLQFEDLPAPASQTGKCPGRKSCRDKRSKKRRILGKLAFSGLLLWAGARYLRFEVPMSFTLADVEWPIPSDMSVDHCEAWSDIGETDPEITDDFPYSADASFELPVSADTLFLISRSVHQKHRVSSGGRVNYVQSDDVSDSIKVDITAFFWHDKFLDGAKACLLKRGDDETGVGIFTKWEDEGHRRRRRHSDHHKLRFDVTVTFPRTEDDSPLAISRFLTDLEIFSQNFADLSHVAFGGLYLKSALSGIHAESLFAGNASITTSLGAVRIQSLVASEARITNALGPIDGTYNASKLTLTTSNAGINVDVNLFHDSDDADAPATLRLSTSNGAINGTLNLLSLSTNADSSSAAAKFDLAAHTSHARLGLAVLSAPPTAHIALRAHTALGPASVSLPATYEGAFHASTSLSSVNVIAREGVEDPSGAGRARRVEWDAVTRGVSKGRVGWDEEGLRRGEVVVGTSLAPVELVF
ncbi:hypothetical protein B0H14DRAFT_2501339 [Mycena olivaceomarginata]|nr:hypothetical protein B0H14DRAFT_2501339 [Mycena olivaceomarginata]